MTVTGVFISLLLLLIALLIVTLHLERKRMHEFLVDFQKKFPGRCPVCSFHEYGVMHGYVEYDEVPDAHACPEERKP